MKKRCAQKPYPVTRSRCKMLLLKETNEELSYVLYVSSKVSKDKKNPMIVALHGLGGDANFIVRERLVDLGEEGGYIAVGPQLEKLSRRDPCFSIEKMFLRLMSNNS